MLPKQAGIVLSVFLLASSAQAWGPHPQITQAALDRLGTNHPLVARLGVETQRLTNYCWIADFKRLPFREPGEDFYADDYLLFPGMTTHLDHICPEVRQTYEPYFQRALQALRTENGTNAARWIGSLLHFAEDTGSPPHAAEYRGDLHIKMENWVDAKQIIIADYSPKLLGETPEAARAGFVRRMDELIEFSKVRGKKLWMQVQIGNRRAVQPVVLESALETSRMTADLLHTLGTLAELPSTNRAVLRGRINLPVGLAMEKLPAKVVLAGTSFSTLANLAGEFEFRNLPPGPCTVKAWRAGAVAKEQTVTLENGRTTVCNLDGDAKTLVRNGEFKIRWLSGKAPDCWYQTDLGWEGEIIPLKTGQQYRLIANFKPSAEDQVLVRWTRQLPHALPQNIKLPKINARPLTARDNVLDFIGSEQMALMQITVRSKRDPSETCTSIELRPVEGAAPKGQ
jgi:carboxypeptidase family protein